MQNLHRHRFAKAGLLVAVFVMSSMTITCLRAQSPAPDFFASFNGSPNAVAADGSLIAPQLARDLTYVPGIHGKAVRLRPSGSVLQYAEGNLLQSNAGTVVFWVQPKWNGSTVAGGQQPIYSLFNAGDRFHIFQFAWLRADVGAAIDPGSKTPGSVLSMTNPCRNSWMAEDWWQIALSWNSNGWTKLYVNGLPYVHGLGYFPSPPLLKHALDFGTIRSFLLGYGSNAAFTDLAIYRRQLSDSELMTRYHEVRPIDLLVERRFLSAGKPENLVVDVYPGGIQDRPAVSANVPTPIHVSVNVSLTSAAMGPILANKTYSLVLMGHQAVTLPLPALSAGSYTATCRVVYGKSTTQQSFSLTAYTRKLAPKSTTANVTLGAPILRINCASQSEGLLSDEPTSVVNSPLGAYREASTKNGARFSYELDLSAAGPNALNGQPMALQIIWPDDKPRSMALYLYKNSPDIQQQRDRLQGGIQSGKEIPLSGKHQTTTYIFYPWATKYLFEVRTKIDDYPAAVAQIVVRPVIGRLPKLLIHTPPANLPQRNFGHLDEDQSFDVMFAYDAPLAQPQRSIRDIELLMDYMDYTGQNILNYDFIRYGDVEYSLPGSGTTNGRYLVESTGVQDLLLDMLDARGKKLIISADSTTISESNKQPDQRSNLLAQNYYQIDSTGNPVHTDGQNGEDIEGNPLNPVYHAQFIAHLNDLLQRYGQHPALYGIEFWPGDWLTNNLRSGYDDLSIADFEHDTKIQVPGTGSDRFAQRYKYLTTTARSHWLAWRVHKNSQIISEVVQRIRKTNPKLIFRMIVTGLPVTGSVHSESADNVNFSKYYYEEQGLDLATLNNIDGLSIVPLRRTNLRWQLERNGMLDTSDEVLDDIRRQAIFHNSRVRGADTYNTYFESFENSLRPKQYSVLFENADVKPYGRNFLKDFSEEMAAIDPGTILVGAQPIGTSGRDEETREYTKAFRALPGGKFQNIPGLNPSVCGRFLPTSNGVYLYLQNLIEANATVNLGTNHPCSLVDLSNGETLGTRKTWAVQLKSFELRSFRLPSECTNVFVNSVSLSSALVNSYAQSVDEAAAQVIQLERDAGDQPQYDRLIKNMRSAQAARNFPEVHRLIFSKLMRQIPKLAGNAKSGYLKAHEADMAAGHYGVRCGSSDYYKGKDGTLFLPDQEYTPNGYGYFGEHNSASQNTSHLRVGFDQQLYHTEAYNTMGYRFTVPNGRYSVRLYNSILYPPDAARGRVVMSLAIQNISIWNGMDLYAALGNVTTNALVTNIENVTVKDKTLTVEWRPVLGKLGWCNAIEITPQKANSPKLPNGITRAKMTANTRTLRN